MCISHIHECKVEFSSGYKMCDSITKWMQGRYENPVVFSCQNLKRFAKIKNNATILKKYTAIFHKDLY